MIDGEKMKLFSVLLWCSGALFSLWGFLVLVSASSSANIPVGLFDYSVLLLALGCIYMAWREFKKPKQKRKEVPYKIGPLQWIYIIGFLGFGIYKYISEQ